MDNTFIRFEIALDKQQPGISTTAVENIRYNIKVLNTKNKIKDFKWQLKSPGITLR